MALVYRACSRQDRLAEQITQEEGNFIGLWEIVARCLENVLQRLWISNVKYVLLNKSVEQIRFLHHDTAEIKPTPKRPLSR
jgi:hypothetical protein